MEAKDLATEYMMKGEQNAMIALAMIDASAEVMGIENFGRVVIDYMMKVATEEEYTAFLSNVAFDKGFLED